MIPIKNLYYMLSYAFVSLQTTTYKWLAHEEFENAFDLYAAILTQGTAAQVKRGLWKGYKEETAPISMLRGSTDVSQSIVQNTMQRRQLICTYDEFTADVMPNRIVKTAMECLLHSAIPRKRKQQLRKVLVYFQDVTTVKPEDIDWHLRYNRNNLSYQLLIGISHLVLTGQLQGTEEGNALLMDFDDIQRRSHLYEKFILNYYRREHTWLRAEASQVAWELEDDYTDLLPIMQTDITLSRGNDVLIIDAKYYGHVLQSYRDARTIHSGNLYQIFTYVKNKDVSFGDRPHRVGGMLLYAKTDELVLPDGTYKTKGSNPISVRTLDLNQDFAGIRKQLDEIVEEYFRAKDMDDSILWSANEASLYIMHRKPGQFLDGAILMKPRVGRDRQGTYFQFVTNRGHLLRGELKTVNGDGIIFDWKDDNEKWAGPINVTVFSDQDFREFKEQRMRDRNSIPKDMDELKRWFIAEME